jgi:arylsulfatase
MGQTVKRKSAKTPNIIIFFPDDMGYGDLSCNGHPTIKTPNIDRLAFYGVKLTNFYSGSPACTASRYSLLTGRYPIRSGFDWVLYPKSDRGIHPNEITLAEVLKKAGYSTAIFGKWHLGSTKKEYLPLQNGFDEYIGLPYSNDMRPPNWSDLPLLHGNDTIELNPDQAKLTKLYTKKAIEFITKKRATPFFVYLPYAMPHVPLYASNEFKGKSKRGIYGDVVEEIDWSVGQIMAALQNNNLDKNTVVFFASDNGPWIIRGLDGGSSGLFKDGKGSTWEGGMRVPGIVYWPDHISQQINTSISSVRDIYVTAIKLANAELPNDRVIDGNNLSNILLQTSTGAPISPSQPFFFYGKSNELLAVRKDVWKLHVQTYSQTGKDYFAGKLPLLFNVNIDPSENHDVSDNHPKIVAELTKLLQQQEISTNEDSNFFDN